MPMPLTQGVNAQRFRSTIERAEYAGLEDLEPGLNVLLHSVVSRADR